MKKPMQHAAYNPDTAGSAPSMLSYLNLIGGSLVPASGGEWIENKNPATGEAYSRIPHSVAADIEAAVAAAKAAFPSWSKLSVAERSNYLRKLADLIEANLESLALAESTDNGKPASLARQVDIPRAAENFRFFADHAEKFFAEGYSDTEKRIESRVERNPLGVVACISPWNLPLYLFTWKIAPALAAGNTVVGKPSEITPATAALLGELSIKAGFPPGVLNIVHGYGPSAGAALCEHPDIAAISFTGGTATGEQIKALAARTGKKATLELGGKNPSIIFADCDYETALTTAVRSSFANQGQICLCGSRIFVERSLYDRFKSDFVDRASKLVVGDPLDPATQQGALVSEAHMQKVLGYIELAKAEGGTILCGGSRTIVEGRCKDGYFVKPTVIEGLSSTCRTNQEEIFGPVVTLSPFDTESEVLAFANSTRYGLAANVWTNDREKADRLAHLLEFGIVWINCWMLRDLRTPFGGEKDSGLGREGGDEALRFFTRSPKTVSWPQS